MWIFAGWSALEGAMDVAIRTCREDDLPSLAVLMQELEEVAGTAAELHLENIRKTWQKLEADPEHYLTLVADAGERVVGAASLLFYRSFLHKVGTAQINELVVSKEMRGQGIGEKLVQACREEALRRGMDELEVGTELENKTARTFYRRMGFTGEYVLLGMDFEYPEGDDPGMTGDQL